MTTFVCQSTFQTGSWLLCKDVNVTVICNEIGNWEPITSTDIDDECTDKSGIALTMITCMQFESNTSIF